MKKSLFASAFAVFALASSLNAAALEGREYIVLKEAYTPEFAGKELNQKSVTEVWSYRCTHCYSHHRAGTMGKIQQAYPNAFAYYMIVPSMGDYGKQAAQILAYAEYLDAKNGVKPSDNNSYYHKVSDSYFKAYFRKNQRWGNGKNPEKFYAQGLKVLGISQAELDKFIASSEGQKIINAQSPADEISKHFGTPGFVVNGKYEINISKIANPQQLIEVIGELLEK